MEINDFTEVENDLIFFNGDLVIGPSDNQHILDILQSEPGWWKEFPQVGAGVNKLLKGKLNVQKVEGVIKLQLETDGYQVGRPQVKIDENGKAIIKPNATRI